MQPDRSPKSLQFFVVLLSVGATSVYAARMTPGAFEQFGAVGGVAYLGGLAMPFVLRLLLNRLLDSVGCNEPVTVTQALAGVFVPFIMIPIMLSTTARRMSEAAESAGVQHLDGARHRIGTLAVLYGVSTFILPTVGAAIGAAIFPFEFGWAFGIVASGLGTAMLLAIATQLLLSFADTIVVETRGRAPISLGGTGGDSPVGVRSV
jgi:hypothetical protein